MIRNKEKVASTRLITSDYELLRKMALRDDKRISTYLRKIIKKVIEERESNKPSLICNTCGKLVSGLINNRCEECIKEQEEK